MAFELQDYSLRLAQKHVEEYRDRGTLVAQHAEAMECRDCEDFLESGITAYTWLRRADRTLRQAAVEGFEVPEDAPKAIAILYRLWLLPCPHAEERIKQQEERDFRLRNLAEFRKACEYVSQQVRLLDMEESLEDAYRGGVFDAPFWQDAGTIPST